jgi:hypothetical protein
MGFISTKASKIAAGGGGGTGGYMTASKLGDGESYRVAILSDEPLEYFTVWGESDEGQKKPFRFVSEPSPSDIEEELGEFKQRMNYEGTELEKPKFGLSFFVFDYADEKVKVFEITQKTLMKELDGISQSEDYEDFAAWDMVFSREGLKMNTTYKILPGPRKKGFQEKIDAAWSAAQGKGYDLQQLLVGGSPFGEAL